MRLDDFFLRQMCNTLIGRATDMLAGGEVFRLIEQDQHREAVALLEMSLKVRIAVTASSVRRRQPTWDLRPIENLSLPLVLFLTPLYVFHMLCSKRFGAVTIDQPN